MAILSIFGFLIDPTNSYSSQLHLTFSKGFVWFVCSIVSTVTPLAFVLLGTLALGQLSFLHPFLPNFVQYLLNSPVILPLGAYAGFEVIWHFYCRSLEQGFNVPTSFCNPGLTPEARNNHLTKVLEHCSNPWEALARWFYTHHPDFVGEDCLQEWICWAFFSKDAKDLSSREEEELKGLVARVVERFPDKPLLKTEGGRLNFMRLHFDPIVVQHKPLIAYLVISLMQGVAGAYMSWVLGFRHYSLPGATASSKSTLSYWLYTPKKDDNHQSDLPPRMDDHNENIRQEAEADSDPDSEGKPIFIVHGIGIGVTMYINMIKSVVSESGGRRPIVFLNLPHISLNVVDSVPNVGETMAAVDEIFRRHKLGSASWVAHSYGTIVTTWVLKQRPDYVDKIVFVDPVCFALWEPDLIYNFLYRVPHCPIHRIAQYFVAQDLLVSYTLFRNFWWLENLLFPEDVPCSISVFLSSHDFIIDGPKMYRYLVERVEKMEMEKKKKTGNGNFEVIKMNGLSHGSFLNSRKFTKDIVNCL